MSSAVENANDSVASRKLAAAELRKARKASRDPRNRLHSDSSDEVPKGILKNARIPTKRSVSECVDDLSQIMAELNLTISDLPRATSKFCPHHQYFEEEEEEEEDDDDDDNADENQECDEHEEGDEDDDEGAREEDKYHEKQSGNGKTNNRINRGSLKKCDCNIDGDSNNNEKPKKSVRFDEHVYETVFFASRLYDRRYFAKYHFSSRHHPPTNQNNKSKKKRSKSESSKDDHDGGLISLKSDVSSTGCKLSKSQRAKQSKKDKKRRLNKKDDLTDTSSDDQGYCSSIHSFSD